METNSKNKKKKKNIRDLYNCIDEFKKRYQPRVHFIQDDNGDL
jgi:hypothetical protein